MVIRSNISALQIHRNWQEHNTEVGKAIERLSSGYKINRAADDAFGLAISQKMKLQLDFLRSEQSSVQNQISANQIRGGYLDGLQDMLLRMGELAARCANGTLSDFDRLLLDNEYQQLVGDLGQYPAQSMQRLNLFSGPQQSQTGGEAQVIALDDLTGFLSGIDTFLNAVSSAARSGDDAALLSLGFPAETKNLQGAALREAVIRYACDNAADFAAPSQDPQSSSPAKYTLTISGGNITVESQAMEIDWLGLADTHLRDADSAGKAMDAIRAATSRVASYTASASLLEHTINRLSAMEENLMAAISRITDADMAKETMNLMKAQVLEQVTTLLAAQTSRQPELVLRLLDPSVTI